MVGSMLESAQAFAKRAQEEVQGDVPDIDLAVFRAMFGLSRVTSRLIADFESVVQRPRGVSWAGFRLLFCLQVSGPLQTGELARLLFTTAPTVSSVVKTLERRGLVRRERLDNDRRLVEMHLTPAGRQLVARVSQAQHERERGWVDEISQRDLAAFVRVVEHLANRSRPRPGPGPG